MNSEPQRFNCPRRLITLRNPVDEWEANRWDGGEHVVWPDSSPKPRTCTYCGGVHPDDVIPLLIAGWQLDRTTKAYKFYLNAPQHRSAVPPVKIYLMHWTQEQVNRADEVLRARAAFDEGGRQRND
ncbi:hypothetical protein [Burkholderia ubonensis]|uniref:hypothetical protein n=1 Tax=Burkholderia ubonensis TaxID=101571 RepID=UPI00114D35D6|nr:hypothetical protein [Burkholderia ubonensis]